MINFNNFKKKYKLNIEDFNIEKLKLYYRDVRNEIFEDLSNIVFKELKELDLSVNKITDI